MEIECVRVNILYGCQLIDKFVPLGFKSACPCSLIESFRINETQTAGNLKAMLVYDFPYLCDVRVLQYLCKITILGKGVDDFIHHLSLLAYRREIDIEFIVAIVDYDR